MTTQIFDAAHARYLGEQRQGALATIAGSGSPQAKPVGFRYDPHRGTIEVCGYDIEHSAKFRNVAASPQVAFTVYDAPDPLVTGRPGPDPAQKPADAHDSA